MDERSDATDEPCAGLERLLRVLLEIVLGGEDTLCGQLLDLRLTVVVPERPTACKRYSVPPKRKLGRDSPVVNIRCPAYAQRAAGVDESGHGILVAGSDDSLLVRFGRARLRAGNEPRADPHCLRAPREIRSEPPAVVDSTSTNHVNRLARQGRLAGLANVNARGDEDRRRDVTGVTSALTSLGADEVDADVKRLLDVLRVADHLIGTSRTLRHFTGSKSGREDNSRS